MAHPILGTVYALERADLMQVYVGQTIELPKRMIAHRWKNTESLFTGEDPTVITHGEYGQGNDLNLAETRIAREYEAAGWDVVSRNTDIPHWTSQQWSDETNEKRRIAMLGHPVSEETRRRMSEKARGRVVTDAAREALKQAKDTPEAREVCSQSGALGVHVRWHVNRDIVSPDCELCSGS
jgi:predicted GIY-YIG superfamily endonuclease